MTPQERKAFVAYLRWALIVATREAEESTLGADYGTIAEGMADIITAGVLRRGGAVLSSNYHLAVTVVRDA